MNKGTALKWIECLKNPTYNYMSGQLRYENYYCPIGVLADFLDPNGWTEDYIGYSWHENKFFLNEYYMKKCKIKHRNMYFKMNGTQFSLIDDIIDNMYTKDYDTVIYYIENFYDQF